MDERTEIDGLIALTQGGLVDSFANLMSQVNDGNYADAAVSSYSLAIGLGLFSKGLAAEAIARRLEDAEGLDKPE